MALTVRFPTRLVVTYNTANCSVSDQDGEIRLYTAADKLDWVATIQASARAVVEAVPACRERMVSEKACLASLASAIETRSVVQSSQDAWDLARIKRALRGFHAGRRAWT